MADNFTDEDEPDGLVPKSIFRQEQLNNILSNLTEISEKKHAIKKHLNELMTNDALKVPEFDAGLKWLNTSRPLFLHQDLTGRIVVLDFFTYCCINCIHILSDLHLLEKKFSLSDGLAIIGVHSAKFENERVLKNIAEAVLKYKILHPVMNDHEAKLWNELQVFCWPTLVILGPQGQILFSLVGEGHSEELFLFCEVALAFFKERNQIINSHLPLQLLKASSCLLSFPGKVETDCDGKIIIIADSGHNRILLVSRSGLVMDQIGDLEPGFQDGSFLAAKFNFPQGIAWKDPGKIYVADTGNHAIRLIDLDQRIVQTVAGNGVPGKDKEGGNLFVQQPLNSPWDLCLGPCAGSSNGNDALYIAMAGTHQIWVLFLEDCTRLDGRYYRKGTCVRFAGSGKEENRNNIYSVNAGFAQPSGITLSSKGTSHYLFVADSESSTIRSISLQDGSVKNVVGGDKDPSNLFAFGDQDSIGLEVRLQHPLGIASKSPEELFVADTYNHKIKIVNPETKCCKTYCGTGCAENKQETTFEEVEFSEPSGVCITDNGKTLLVADTNNHTIKIIDLEKKIVSELFLSTLPHLAEDVTDNSTKVSSNSDVIVKLQPVKMSWTSKLKLCFNIQLGTDLDLTEEAPHQWNVHIKGTSSLDVKGEKKGRLQNLFTLPEILLEWSNQDSVALDVEVNVLLKLYLCSKLSKICFCQTIEFSVPVYLEENDIPEATVSLTHTVNCHTGSK